MVVCIVAHSNQVQSSFSNGFHFPMVAMGDKTCFLLCESVGRSVKDVLASPMASGSQNCPFIQSNKKISIS